MRFHWRACQVLTVLLLACGPGAGDAPCEASCAADDAECLARVCIDTPDEALRAASDCSSLPEGGRCLGTRVVERWPAGRAPARGLRAGRGVPWRRRTA
ncbi:hypothetical protein ACLESD_48325, partial [Pyxidicoccus sp. 3LFB2]